MTLQSLIDRVEAGSGSDRQLDADICVALRYAHMISEGETIARDGDDGKFIVNNEYNFARRLPAPSLTASLDAIRALFKARLEKYWVFTGENQNSQTCRVEVFLMGDESTYEVDHIDIHRAFLAAVLKAIAIKEG